MQFRIDELTVLIIELSINFISSIYKQIDDFQKNKQKV